MNVLGSFGNLYMAALLILLVVGVLYAIYYFVQKIVALVTGSDQPKGRAAAKTKGGGDSIMKNSNGWLKLAIFSFVGLIISVVLLNVTNPANTNTTAYTGNQHSAHVNGTATVGGTVNGGVTMDQMNNIMQQMSQLQQQMMQMQQQYTGQMSSGMSSSGSMGNSGSMMDDKDMMNQMNQMNNTNNMNNMNNSNSNSSSSGGGMSMM